MKHIFEDNTSFQSLKSYIEDAIKDMIFNDQNEKTLKKFNKILQKAGVDNKRWKEICKEHGLEYCENELTRIINDNDSLIDMYRYLNHNDSNISWLIEPKELLNQNNNIYSLISTKIKEFNNEYYSENTTNKIDISKELLYDIANLCKKNKSAVGKFEVLTKLFCSDINFEKNVKGDVNFKTYGEVEYKCGIAQIKGSDSWSNPQLAYSYFIQCIYKIIHINELFNNLQSYLPTVNSSNKVSGLKLPKSFDITKKWEDTISKNSQDIIKELTKLEEFKKSNDFFKSSDNLNKFLSFVYNLIQMIYPDVENNEICKVINSSIALSWMRIVDDKFIDIKNDKHNFVSLINNDDNYTVIKNYDNINSVNYRRFIATLQLFYYQKQEEFNYLLYFKDNGNYIVFDFTVEDKLHKIVDVILKNNLLFSNFLFPSNDQRRWASTFVTHKSDKNYE